MRISWVSQTKKGVERELGNLGSRDELHISSHKSFHPAVLPVTYCVYVTSLSRTHSSPPAFASKVLSLLVCSHILLLLIVF